MNLLSYDIVVMLKIICFGDRRWTYKQLAYELGMSTADAHKSVKRAANAKMFDLHNRKPLKGAIKEFAVHGVKYAYPVVRGEIIRGMATSYGAPPLNQIISGGEFPPVWPDAEGEVRGYNINPLWKRSVKASKMDKKLYEYLAIVDAIRDGNVREKRIAAEELRKLLTA
jgi:hypothetical protein